jgi:hypothetical protein
MQQAPAAGVPILNSAYPRPFGAKVVQDEVDEHTNHLDVNPQGPAHVDATGMERVDEYTPEDE